MAAAANYERSAGAVVERGWSLQGICQHQTSPPLGFANIIFNGGLKNLLFTGSARSAERWFNIDAGFERDPARQLAWNKRTFALRLSGVRSDGFNQWDLSAFKTFRVTERVRFQVRAEARNARHRPMFAAPNTAPAKLPVRPGHGHPVPRSAPHHSGREAELLTGV